MDKNAGGTGPSAQQAEGWCAGRAATDALRRARSKPAGGLRRAVVALRRSYAFVGVGLCCAALAYLLVWQRGPYLDDYSNGAMAVDVVTAQWRPAWSSTRIPTYPARALTWLLNTTVGGLLPTHELAIRVVSAVLVATNAFLLGSLVYRVAQSRLAGVISAWLFVAPLWGFEALLWAGAVTYVLLGTLALLWLHLLWTALLSDKRPIVWAGLGYAVFAVMLLVGEPYVGLLGVFPLLALAASGGRGRVWRLVRRSLTLVLPCAAMTLAAYFLLYRNSGLVMQRGGVDVSVFGTASRCLGWLRRAWWMTLSDSWGLKVFREAVALGAMVVRGSLIGVLLICAASAFLVVTVLGWQTAAGGDASLRAATALFFAGAVWFLLVMLFPGATLRGQILEYRMLYFPTAGLAASAGALASVLGDGLHRVGWARLVLLTCGLLVLLNATGTAGLAEALARRSRLDALQAAAIRRAVPSSFLPAGAYIVPADMDQSLSGRPDALSLLLLGAFEVPWAGRDLLAQTYRRSDMHLVTSNRWAPLRFDCGHGPTAERVVTVQGANLPVESTLVLAYHSGRAYAVERVILKGEATERAVLFPIAERLALAGFPTQADLEVQCE